MSELLQKNKSNDPQNDDAICNQETSIFRLLVAELGRYLDAHLMSSTTKHQKNPCLKAHLEENRSTAKVV